LEGGFFWLIVEEDLMTRKLIPSVIAIAATLCLAAGAPTKASDDSVPAAALKVTPAVAISSGELSAPVTEVQYRRYYRRAWRNGYPYRSSYGYSPRYSYYPRYSYGYYPGYYSSYRPYYRGYNYPRYSTGYRGFSYYSPWVSGSYYW
jgi:hypothetical protein